MTTGRAALALFAVAVFATGCSSAPAVGSAKPAVPSPSLVGAGSSEGSAAAPSVCQTFLRDTTLRALPQVLRSATSGVAGGTRSLASTAEHLRAYANTGFGAEVTRTADALKGLAAHPTDSNQLTAVAVAAQALDENVRVTCGAS